MNESKKQEQQQCGVCWKYFDPWYLHGTMVKAKVGDEERDVFLCNEHARLLVHVRRVLGILKVPYTDIR